MSRADDNLVEQIAKAIARMVPGADGSRWNPDHGHKFPLEYSTEEAKLIRGIARTALDTIQAWQSGPDQTQFLLRSPDYERFVCAIENAKAANAELRTLLESPSPFTALPPHDQAGRDE